MSSRKVSEAGAIVRDIEGLLESDIFSTTHVDCACKNACLKRVIYAYNMTDIVRSAKSFRDPVVVALEYRRQGSRLFCCTSRSHIFHFLCLLRAQRPNYCTWHEILTDSNPLRLYFDFDFYYASNGGVNADGLLEKFRETVAQCLRNRYGVKSSADVRFVEFDASTTEKFSRHLIAHCPGVAFGKISKIFEFITQYVLPSFGEEIFVFAKDGRSKTNFMDTSVYGRGQNLRLLGSPKFGRENTLKYVNFIGDHEFAFHDFRCENCETMFIDCLATESNFFENSNTGKLTLNKELFDFVRFTSNGKALKMLNEKEKYYFFAELFRRISNDFSVENNDVTAKLFLEATKASTAKEFCMRKESEENRFGELNELYAHFFQILQNDAPDMDHLHSIAAQILHVFTYDETEKRSGENSEDTLEEDKEKQKASKRLRELYGKITKWKTSANFRVEKFAATKSAYDKIAQSFHEEVMIEFPRELNTDNFDTILELLAALDSEEMERRRKRNELENRKAGDEIAKMQHVLQSEKAFAKILQNSGFSKENLTDGERAYLQKAVDMALVHSQHVMQALDECISNLKD